MMVFSENSKVWVYQSNREFNDMEIPVLRQMLSAFTTEWTAHQQQLQASAEIRYNRFIILMVDEDVHAASGCSIDKSVNFLKQIEGRFNITLFDRMQCAYWDSDILRTCSSTDFACLIREGMIGSDTIVFNNLIASKKELDSSWQVPLKNSWHAQFFADDLKSSPISTT